jgi:hypothetical protein
MYENNNEGLNHYVSYLGKKRDEEGYVYRTHNFPHDIMVHELSTGKTRYEALIKYGLNKQTIKVIPKLSLHDGIEATKRIFHRFFIDEKLDRLIKAMSLYGREWDEKLGVYKSEPKHDEWSHIMDAGRTLGVGFMEEMVNTGRETLQPQEEEMDDLEKYRVVGLI